MIVFDLEFGQPAASTPLPKSRPAFRDVLGCYGLRAAGRGLHDGGVDLLYLSHQARRQCSDICESMLATVHDLSQQPRINRTAAAATEALQSCLTCRLKVKAGAHTHMTAACQCGRKSHVLS